jgi:hypothetical protein
VTALLGALASVAFAGLIVVAGYATSAWLLAGAVAIAVLALALGWPTLLDLPAPRGSAVVVGLTGAAGVVTAIRAADVTRPLAPFAALLAGAVLLAFAHELVRRHGRPHLVESVTGTLSGQTLALLGGGWALLPNTRLGLTALVTAAAAAAAARLASAVPVPARISGWVCLVVGTVVGGGVGLVLEPRKAWAMVVAAAVVASAVAGLDRLLLALAAGRSLLPRLAGAAAPVLAVGTVAYAVARLVP